MENRDEILRLDDPALAALCKLEFFKGSGKGGQHRNKVSSAVRVSLENGTFSAEDCSERSQHRNRANALAKLRRKIALEVRVSPAVAPERPDCSPGHPDYALCIAGIFDLLEEAGFDHRAAAAGLGITPSALVRLLGRDTEVWQCFCRRRAAMGLTALRPD